MVPCSRKCSDIPTLSFASTIGGGGSSAIDRNRAFPFIVSSGYRCPEHPIEAAKDRAGSHTTGCAIDLSVRGKKALKVLEVAIKHGIKRIGVNQKGKGRFIHLDMAEDDYPSPAIWSY